jgi:SSS family solute:Na+ symporter
MYVFFGGVRGTAWANAFQTMVFIVLGMVTFSIVATRLGGLKEATALVAEHNPTKLKRSVTEEDIAYYEAKLAAYEADPEKAVIKPLKPKRPGITKWQFFTYLFIPLSVGMFPHLFQHWLTAKSARSFKLPIVAHPLLIMIVWVPCVLLGVWATSAIYQGKAVIPADFANINAVLALMVKKMTNQVVGGLLTAGILAAIMSSLDSQFLCIGSIFTNDVVAHYIAADKLSDRSKVILGRAFVVFIVLVTYLLAIKLEGTRGVFTMGVWCFSGFASLFPLVMAALYWRGATAAGAMASVLVMAGTWLYLFREAGYGADRDYLFMGMMPVATICAASCLALVVVSMMTRKPSQATIGKFFSDRASG